jgi:hypothetical protein
MGRFTVMRSNLDHIKDPQLRQRLEDRHVVMDMDSAAITVTFYQGTLAIAERRYEDHSINYVMDAAENWCSGIMDCHSFDMEERLRA